MNFLRSTFWEASLSRLGSEGFFLFDVTIHLKERKSLSYYHAVPSVFNSKYNVLLPLLISSVYFVVSSRNKFSTPKF